MAKRNKKRGAGFGQRSGSKSSELQKAREQRQTLTYTLIGVAGVLSICLLLWFFSQDGLFNFGSSATNDNPITENDGNEGSAATGSVSELSPEQRNNFYSTPFDMTIDTNNDYEAVFVTEKGEMRFRLYDDITPVTVNNFVNLAQDGFYDNTTFHRVLADFMAQGGDPTGTGTGGPGYRFQDEVDNDLTFDRRGLLAMANSGPATNGSQFFITFEPTPHLNGAHTIFGELLEGDDVLAALDLRNPSGASEPGDLIETIEIEVVEG